MESRGDDTGFTREVSAFRGEQKVDLPQLSLRPAVEGDCVLLWHWRNEGSTRKWSLNSACIPYEEHEGWFLSKLNSADSKVFIIAVKGKGEIGQVRLDIEDKTAEISISIEGGQRNKGYGSAALKLACQHALEELNVAKVIAHIKEGNTESIAAFTKAGFINKGFKDYRGYRVLEMMIEMGGTRP